MTRRKLPMLFTLLGTGVVLLGVLMGALILHIQTNGAHAASPPSVYRLKMSQKDLSTSILPLRPVYSRASKMDRLNKSAHATQAEVACLGSNTRPLCYSPQQIRQAYGVQALLDQGITGKGRIITIIDAFQDPAIKDELHQFDQMFGLNDPQLNIIAPFGLTAFNPKDDAQTGFAGEIALDVEWAHAIAPDATIDLALANVKDETLAGELNAILQITDYVVKNSIGSVISQSFGISESCAGTDFIQQEHKLFQQARVQQQSVFASAGDSGASALQCDANGNAVAVGRGVNYPASDPLVSSVGGTTLRASANGQYISETTWNDARQGDGATGGGVSQVFKQPAFQQKSIQSTSRAVSDIALDADPLTGVVVVSSEVMPGHTMALPIGGTSVGSPVIAAMAALFDQVAGKRLGFLNAAFYRLSLSGNHEQLFHDIRSGNNSFVLTNNGQTETIQGFRSGTGWDAPTGVGSPNLAALAAALPDAIQANDGADL